MKKSLIFLFLASSIILNSCMNDKATPLKQVDYSALYVVNAIDNSISIIKTTTNTVTDKIDLPNCNYPYHIYISPNKKLLAVSVTNFDMSNGFPVSNYSSYNSGNKIIILDAIKKTIEKEISLPQLASNAIFSPNGSELWVGQADDLESKILIYNVADWTLQQTILLKKGLSEITFCTDGDMSFSCTSGEDSVQMYNVSDKSFLMNTGLPNHPTGAYPSDHHTDFIVCDGNNMVYEVNATDCLTIDTMTLAFKPAYIKYNSAKSEMWMSDVTNGSVHWFTIMGSHWIDRGAISVGNNPRWIIFNSDESIAYVAVQNSNYVSIINVSNHSFIKNIDVGKSPSSMAIKP